MDIQNIKDIDVNDIESLNDKELLTYGNILGINIKYYSEELLQGKYLIKDKSNLIKTILERRFYIIRETDIKQKTDIAIIAAIVSLLCAIISFVKLLYDLKIIKLS